MAADFATWNSVHCGECIKLTSSSSSVYSRVVDQCGPITGFNTHFDLDPVSFQALFGDAGIDAGHGIVEWTVVSSSECKGNLF
jgi:hypothetical protein